MTLEEYRFALGLRHYQMAEHAEHVSKEHITPQLLRHAEQGRPIAEVKAQAICKYLSQKFAQEIKPEDITGLKTC